MKFSCLNAPNLTHCICCNPLFLMSFELHPALHLLHNCVASLPDTNHPSRMTEQQNEFSSMPSSPKPLKSPSSPPRAPATSHLTPCSWQHFLEQDFPPEHHVDLVSGFLVTRPVMADVEHQDIITRLTTLINILGLCFFANFTPPSKVADYEDASRSSPRSPDSNSSPRKIPGKREPDIALSRRDEESSDSSASLEKKKIKFSQDRLPLAVIEVTSSSTRTEDLYDKWAFYARTGYPRYIILDRTCARVANHALDDSPIVIVGSLDASLEQVPGWQHCANGDPEQSPKKTRYYASDAGGSARCYYRKVYKRDQIVDCLYLKDLGLAARELLDEKFLRNRYEQILAQIKKNERAKRQAEERAGKSESARCQAEERANKAEELLRNERSKRKALQRA